MNSTKQRLLFLFLIIWSVQLKAQYKFEGHLADDVKGNTVYLSIIEDFRKLSRVYPEQIFKKAQTDSLGHFVFEGSNISNANGIYRIHINECPEGENGTEHYFRKCKNSRSVLFIANNRDSIFFERTFGNEMFCDIRSTNPKSDVFLQIDAEKENMIFDFSEFRSEANRKLNNKKWFTRLQQFGANFNEPLAELYTYDFLSDRRNETYAYYLNDVVENTYYDGLGQRLEEKYPNTVFTELYQTEIATDQQMANQNKLIYSNLKWILGSLLGLSILLNIYLIYRQKFLQKNHKNSTLGKLTAQEQKIVNEILKDKTNKEIASDMFISLSTVKTHINNLYKKLNVTSRDEIKEFLG